jgi:hypothetical protein
VFQPNQISTGRLQQLLDLAWETFYRDEYQPIKMARLFQQVVRKEMADNTYRPRNRDLAGQAFGRRLTG